MSDRTIPPLYFTDEPFEKALDERVLRVWNLEQYEQRTPEWYEARMRCISASSISSALMQTEEACREYISQFHLEDSYVINPKKNCSYKDSQLDLIMGKCGLGDGFKGNEYTLWGQKYEPVVSNIYSQMNTVDMLEFGLIFHPTVPFLAASPDGISTKGIMLEIKCPPIRAVKPYPPLYYFQQILMQLECCGLDECDYFDCNFVEYLDKNGWYDEGKAWENENPDATHHLYGIIVSYVTGQDEDGKDVLFHVYPPPTVVEIDDFLKWSETEMEKLEMENRDVEITLYKLHEYFISRVKSSKSWFEQNLSTMAAIWDKVLLGRTTDGFAALKQIKDDKEDKRVARRAAKVADQKKAKKEFQTLKSLFVDLDISGALPYVPEKKSYYKHKDCLFSDSDE